MTNSDRNAVVANHNLMRAFESPAVAAAIMMRETESGAVSPDTKYVYKVDRRTSKRGINLLP